MQKTVFTCDCCKKEVKDKFCVVFKHEINEKGEICVPDKIDICNDCWNLAMQAINGYRPVDIKESKDFTDAAIQ